MLTADAHRCPVHSRLWFDAERIAQIVSATSSHLVRDSPPRDSSTRRTSEMASIEVAALHLDSQPIEPRRGLSLSASAATAEQLGYPSHRPRKP